MFLPFAVNKLVKDLKHPLLESSYVYEHVQSHCLSIDQVSNYKGKNLPLKGDWISSWTLDEILFSVTDYN